MHKKTENWGENMSSSKSGVYPQETLSRSKKVVEINNLCIIGSWEDDKDQGIKIACSQNHDEDDINSN